MVDITNAIDKLYIYKLMYNVQQPGSKLFGSQMQMHTINQNNDVSVSKYSQQYLSEEHRKNCVIDQGKLKKEPVKINVQTENIMFRIMLMLHTTV